VTAETGIWAYAVAERITPRWFAGITGVGGGGIRTVGKDGLVAAVSEVSMAEYGEQALRSRLEDLDWLEAAARGHHRVIEAVAQRQPVVPLRLATVYRSRAGVAGLLSERQETFRNALGRVTARSEWGVKVYAAPPEPPAPPGTGTGGGPGAAYLRRRQQQVSAAHEARRAAASDAGQVHAALRPLAVASMRRPPQDPNLTRRAEQMLLNVAYLVDDSQQARFTAEADGLAARLPGIRVELTGPWPPYSFAVSDEEPTE
jgi:gas vesicle protein GvpL/GvpF